MVSQAGIWIDDSCTRPVVNPNWVLIGFEVLNISRLELVGLLTDPS